MIYPFVTYPSYVGVLLLSFLKYRLKLSRKNLILIIILASLLLSKVIEALLSSYIFLLSDLSEFKIIFFIIILLLVKTKMSRRAASTLYISYIIFGLACMIYVFINTGQIVRFMDRMPGFTHYLSIYFTVTAACFLAVLPTKIVPYLFVVVSASGTGLLAIIPIFLLRLFKSYKNPFSWALILTVAIIAIYFVLSIQASRGRTLLDPTSIDRFLFYSAIFEYIPNMSWKHLLIGHYLGEHIPVENYVPPRFAEYLLAERAGYIPPRMFHSDYLRLFLQYGLLGMAFILYCLWISVTNRVLLSVLLAGALVNSVFYISPIMITVFYLNRISANEEV